jgi:4-amino-4-deoxy-L-arabinose transferase-like glycosyltransferase
VVFTVPALIGTIRDQWQSRRSAEDAVPAATEADDGLNAFLIVWVLVPIVFFSISRSKLPGYILPSIPPAAILTAVYLHGAGISRLKLMLHSLVCGVLMAGALVAPFSMMREPIPVATRYIIAVSAGVVAVLVLLYVRKSGLRVLRFVTVIPVVMGLMLLLRLNALTIDETQSSRSINLQLSKLGAENSAVAVFNARREVEYGLNFYRNRPIPRYERDGVPGTDHVVVAKQGSGDAVQALVTGGKVMRLGEFPPQRLEFFRVTYAK